MPTLPFARAPAGGQTDRKSTRLNSSHLVISYAVFCLKKDQHFSRSRAAFSPLPPVTPPLSPPPIAGRCAPVVFFTGYTNTSSAIPFFSVPAATPALSPLPPPPALPA